MAINVFCTAPLGRFLDTLKIPSNINLKIAEYAVDEDLKNGLRWCDRHISNARIVIHDDLLADCQNLEFIYQPSIGALLAIHQSFIIQSLMHQPFISYTLPAGARQSRRLARQAQTAQANSPKH